MYNKPKSNVGLLLCCFETLVQCVPMQHGAIPGLFAAGPCGFGPFPLLDICHVIRVEDWKGQPCNNIISGG